MLKRLCDIGLSDPRRVEDVTEKKARRSTDCITARVGRKSGTKSGSWRGEQWANTSKKDRKCQRGITSVPSEGRSMEEKPSDSAKVGI